MDVMEVDSRWRYECGRNYTVRKSDGIHGCLTQALLQNTVIISFRIQKRLSITSGVDNFHLFFWFCF